MSLPVLRVRHHSVIGGRDGDVLACASVGPAGDVAAVWTTPEGLGPVTSTTVSAAGAWFPDPAAARPVAARITVHTPDLAAVTRIADRSDPVPDAVWDEAARHYDERALAGLLIGVTAINAWNRLNVSTHQHPVDWSQAPSGWKPEAAAPATADARA